MGESLPRSCLSPIKAYLFDLDGTLVDTVPDYRAALNHCMELASLERMPVSFVRDRVGRGAKSMVHDALAEQGSHVSVDDLLPYFLDYYRNHIAVHSTVYPTVVETLRSLCARDCLLAIVTNKRLAFSEALLSIKRLREFFAVVTTGGNDRKLKPDPEPIVHTLRQLGVSPAEALFIGDSRTDVDAANAADVAVAFVRGGYDEGVELSSLKVDRVLDKLSDLLQ